MKTGIEDIIRADLSRFDDETPAEGHFRRFEEKLKGRKNTAPKRRLPRSVIISISSAAAVLVMVLAAKSVMSGKEEYRPDQNVKEVAEYYSFQLMKQAAALENKARLLDDEADQKEIMEEVDKLTRFNNDEILPYMTSEEQIIMIVSQYNDYSQSLENISLSLSDYI